MVKNPSMQIQSPEQISFKNKLEPNERLRLKTKINQLLNKKSPRTQSATALKVGKALKSKLLDIKQKQNLNENSKMSLKRNTFNN